MITSINKPKKQKKESFTKANPKKKIQNKI